MDAIVEQAIVKWPHVPSCTGWLGLDCRGRWYLRDAAAQACGAFTSAAPGARGARLQHPVLLAFIGRNYEADERGRWFFQNGPQRVFVELEAAPWILRLQPDGSVLTHTGRRVQALGAWLDDAGRLFLQTDAGLGVVHPQDMVDAAAAIERGRWSPQPIGRSAIERHFGFVASPQADARLRPD